MPPNIPSGAGDEGESEWGEKGEVRPLKVGEGMSGLFIAMAICSGCVAIDFRIVRGGASRGPSTATAVGGSWESNKREMFS